MLQTWNALRVEHVKQSGRTRPLIIECAGDDGERQTLIVKARGLPEVDNLGLYCELSGNLMARELGLDTPQPSLVIISQEFVTNANSFLRSSNLKLEVGLAVGAEYFSKDFSAISAFSPLANEQIESAVRIYSFDLLVQNPDRLRTNPNCALSDKRLIAFDFNLAFSFLLPILGQKVESWEFSKLHAIRQNHLFFNQLRRRTVDWQPFIKSVNSLTKERIIEICEAVPTIWGSHTNRICEHLLSAAEKHQELEFELQKSFL